MFVGQAAQATRVLCVRSVGDTFHRIHRPAAGQIRGSLGVGSGFASHEHSAPVPRGRVVGRIWRRRSEAVSAMARRRNFSETVRTRPRRYRRRRRRGRDSSCRGRCGSGGEGAGHHSSYDPCGDSSLGGGGRGSGSSGLVGRAIRWSIVCSGSPWLCRRWPCRSVRLCRYVVASPTSSHGDAGGCDVDRAAGRCHCRESRDVNGRRRQTHASAQRHRSDSHCRSA